jgi:hypothetical protein
MVKTTIKRIGRLVKVKKPKRIGRLISPSIYLKRRKKSGSKS